MTKSNASPLWHPLTQHATAAAPVYVESAKGLYLQAPNGRKIMDAISSWWVITHGHGYPAIIKAVQAQAEKLEQVIFAGFTHGPAEDVAAKLLRLAGANFSHVFLSDSGSTAVEVALKMAIGYWAQTGRPRRRILALEGAYHGDTFGAMAASARSVFSQLYAPYLFQVDRLPFPEAGKEDETLERFESLLRQQGDDIAAFIFEPLVQGASGMKMYRPETLKTMADLARAKGVLLIADEVMTGFGRTGAMFACQQAGVTPDMMALSKGLTGGFLPMGATICQKHIYDAFYHPDRGKMFMHSTSFTGNPLACAAAAASMQVFEDEDVQGRINRISVSHAAAVPRMRAIEGVTNARHLGTIMALDVAAAGEGYIAEISPILYRMFLEQDVLLRPLGNTVYILPPYCITSDELERIYACIEHIIPIALRTLRHGGGQCAA
jgi:adenosylmethionine-8-amino-7-oxononanoate aminotransferase